MEAGNWGEVKVWIHREEELLERVQGWADAHVRPGGGRETETLSLPLTPQGLQPLLSKSLKSSGPNGHISIFGLREDFLRV